MNMITRRWLLWGLVGVAVVTALVLAFRPRALAVETLTVTPGPFRVMLESEGMTRIRDVFTVSAPVAGRLLRNPLEVGDVVIQGTTVVVTVQPADAAFLDPRTLAESRADVEAALSERQLAEAERTRAEAERAFAETELARVRTLFERGSLPQRAVDEAERIFRSADAALAAAVAAVDARTYQVARARARLMAPAADAASGPDGPCDCLELRAPVDGRVLRMFQKSEAVVAAGTPLLEIGDPTDLEIVADFLSEEAVRIVPGQRAEISGWGGDAELEARVRRVEPFGFTKVSALGIEEQRVNVVLDVDGPATAQQGLGHGYRVVARVIGREADDVLSVPVTALFRQAGAWQIFVVEAGVARQREVRIGQRAGLAVEVTEGLAAGEVIVANPPEALAAGVRVRPRAADQRS